MKNIIATAIFASLTLASCSPFQVTSDYAETANFSNYKTYVFRTDDLKINDIDKDRVLNEIAKNLQSKGLSPSQASDLIINVTAGHKKVRENTGPSFGYYGMGRMGSYTYNEGSLVIDIIDSKTNKLVWQGKGNGLDVDSPNSKQKEIPELVAQIMANYPPQK